MISSRTDLIDYCLRRLGAPVIKINVDQLQIEDRIDDALNMFIDYHYDASNIEYYIKLLTADDITNKYITVPNDTISVIRMFPKNSVNGVNNLQYQSYMTDVLDSINNSNGGLISMFVTEQWLSDVNYFFNREEQIRYNRHQGRVFIDTNWDYISEGDWIILETIKALNPNEFTHMYNDRWLKDYSTALIKRMWGQNLIKYQGISLPGGITLDGRQIFEDAQAEIEKLEETLKTDYQLPLNFMVG